MELKVGDYFYHKKWIDAKGRGPLKCKITKIAHGVIYYRPHYDWHDDGTEWLGFPTYFPIGEIDYYVGEMTEPYPIPKDE